MDRHHQSACPKECKAKGQAPPKCKAKGQAPPDAGFFFPGFFSPAFSPVFFPRFFFPGFFSPVSASRTLCEAALTFSNSGKRTDRRLLTRQ